MALSSAFTPVLALNCGSSTVKFKLLDLKDSAEASPSAILARGVVDRVGPGAEFTAERRGFAPARFSLAARGPGQAVKGILAWLRLTFRNEEEMPAAVGHRVVHGGEAFSSATLVTEERLVELEALFPLAPLHNPASLEGMRAVMGMLGAATPNVAVFDTSFHRTLPPEAATYPIPKRLTLKHGIRRFGCHGIAHQYIAERYAQLRGLRLEEVDLVILHLGSGCSACAVKGGRSIDTSMGLTPLEGLMMGRFRAYPPVPLRGCEESAFSTWRGIFSIKRSNVFEAWSGSKRPCSQSRTVATER